MNAVGASERMFELLDTDPRINTTSGTGIVPPDGILSGEISFDAVSFRYPTREDVPVLDKVAFRARAGETVALVGPSGAGKTTVVSLLLRFYDPSEGAISLGGYRLKTLDPVWLKRRIALVSQEPVLFA